MIKGLHHSAYRCRDSEETRKFYQDFLGLKLVGTLDIKDTQSARKNSVLHTFYQMDDGSCLAFICWLRGEEVPGQQPTKNTSMERIHVSSDPETGDERYVETEPGSIPPRPIPGAPPSGRKPPSGRGK